MTYLFMVLKGHGLFYLPVGVLLSPESSKYQGENFDENPRIRSCKDSRQ